ncbi:MAG: glycosyltransferase [Deltaproteobacteria bacterium]|nr:glycosyltransferase [Deltaproteobacteria bacterium]MBW1932247.1 glycosyltransferase [Deltaproteobacteria bacterium]
MAREINTIKKGVYLIDSLTSGGAQRQLVELVKGLDKKTVSPTVVAYHDIPFFRKELLDADIPFSLIEKKDKLGISFFRQFLVALKRNPPDFIHSFLNVPNIYARVAKLFGGVKGVVTSDRNISLTQRFGLTLGEKMTWRLSDVIITNAHAVRDVLINRIGVPPSRIRVVYNGVQAERFSMADREKVAEIRKRCRANKKGTLLIGLVGRVAPQKNHLALLVAMRRILDIRADLDIRVGFCGAEADPIYAQKVRHAVSELRLNEKVFFLGVEKDMASVYQACDVLVLPSLWEGFPNVVLEGMSARRPVIASDIVDNSQIILNGKDGFLVEPNNVESLAYVILTVITLNEDERRAICERAWKKVVSEYSIDKMVQNTMQVYREFGLC